LAVALFALADGTQAAEQTNARLTAICRGRGKIETTNSSGKILVIGREYTMTAKPIAGWVFTNWTDGYHVVITNQPRLTFVMRTNTALIANFVRRTRLAGNLDGVSTADIPLKVLAAVNATPAEQQADVLYDWIESVVSVRRSALASVLSTVLTAHPELLTAAVDAAVAASPAQVYAIVYAASQTPAANLTDIAVTACGAAPTQVYRVVQALLDANPKAGREVLEQVAATIPSLAFVIGNGLATTTGSITKSQALDILTRGLTDTSWPINPALPNQNPYDYSQP
jgi:hypothetical protein